MKIRLNGKEAEIGTGLTVDALLAGMAVVPKAALVELNLKVLRRESWQKTALKEGDAVEVFSFVTGG
ncbi:MAG: sulfur carrier protein ThiS [Elusimicrobia bacterium]|nr:sulfur carrier protein ThiS [Elusimicrobiota bacterium]